MTNLQEAKQEAKTSLLKPALLAVALLLIMTAPGAKGGKTPAKVVNMQDAQGKSRRHGHAFSGRQRRNHQAEPAWLDAGRTRHPRAP